MKNLYLISISLLSVIQLLAQGPEITSWIRNTTSATGYNSLPSNVQIVQYTATDVYVSSSCIPGIILVLGLLIQIFLLIRVL